MRTFYIVRYEGEPTIREGIEYRLLNSAIGPYWTYKEATGVYYRMKATEMNRSIPTWAKDNPIKFVAQVETKLI